MKRNKKSVYNCNLPAAERLNSKLYRVFPGSKLDWKVCESTSDKTRFDFVQHQQVLGDFECEQSLSFFKYK